MIMKLTKIFAIFLSKIYNYDNNYYNRNNIVFTTVICQNIKICQNPDIIVNNSKNLNYYLIIHYFKYISL